MKDLKLNYIIPCIYLSDLLVMFIFGDWPGSNWPPIIVLINNLSYWFFFIAMSIPMLAWFWDLIRGRVDDIERGWFDY